MLNRIEMSVWLLVEMKDQPEGGWSEDMLESVIGILDYPEFRQQK